MADDKYDAARGLFQQGLGVANELEQQKKALLMKQAKEQYEKMKHDRDLFLQQAGVKEFPKSVRQQFFNNAAALDKTLNNGQSSFPAIDTFDDGVADVLDSFGVIDRNKDLDAQTKMQMKRDLITQQNRAQGDMKHTEFLQSMAFGSGPVQTSGQGLNQVQTRITPDAQQIPLQAPAGAQPAAAPKPAAPATVTNKDLQDRLIGLRDKFYSQDAVKDNMFVLGKLSQVQKLAKENPAGAAGALNQTFIRLFEKQRVSDEDFKNLNPSQSGQAKLMDWFNKVKAGKLSNLSADNIRLVSRVLGDKVRQDVNDSIAAQVGADLPLIEGSGLDEQYLQRFYTGSMKKDLDDLNKYMDTGDVDTDVKKGTLTKQEGKYIKKDRNLKPAPANKPLKDPLSATPEERKARIEFLKNKAKQSANKPRPDPKKVNNYGAVRG